MKVNAGGPKGILAPPRNFRTVQKLVEKFEDLPLKKARAADMRIDKPGSSARKGNKSLIKPRPSQGGCHPYAAPLVMNRLPL